MNKMRMKINFWEIIKSLILVQQLLLLSYFMMVNLMDHKFFGQFVDCDLSCLSLISLQFEYFFHFIRGQLLYLIKFSKLFNGLLVLLFFISDKFNDGFLGFWSLTKHKKYLLICSKWKKQTQAYFLWNLCLLSTHPISTPLHTWITIVLLAI